MSNIRELQALTGPLGGDLHALAKIIRPAIIAPKGRFLMWGDWSAVEARLLPYLADDPRAKKKLKAFAASDADPSLPDVYVKNAVEMGLYLDGKPNRQTGKVAELSLGYGGGVGAFQAMARNYGVHVNDDLADDIKQSWRAINPWATDFWRALDRASMNAVGRPGKVYRAGLLEYMYLPHVLNKHGALYCKLPSGRLLTYPGARIEEVEKPWGDEPGITAMKGSWTPKVDAPDWPRFSLWYGLLAENATQAAQADLTNDAIARAFDLGLEICGHTHDELLSVTDEPEHDEPLLRRAMMEREAWAAGVPLKVDIGFGTRYKG